MRSDSVYSCLIKKILFWRTVLALQRLAFLVHLFCGSHVLRFPCSGTSEFVVYFWVEANRFFTMRIMSRSSRVRGTKRAAQSPR